MSIADYDGLLCDYEPSKTEKSVENAQITALASSEFVIEDPLISLGVLEYDKERFAYLRTNKKFLSEFDLIEDIRPASKIFKEHLDEANYDIILQAFADCSNTKEDSLFCINWIAADGRKRKYHGYVHYYGNIGTYADLSVTFINVTGMRRYGF